MTSEVKDNFYNFVENLPDSMHRNFRDLTGWVVM